MAEVVQPADRPGSEQEGGSFDEQLVEVIGRRRAIAAEHLDLIITSTAPRTCTHHVRHRYVIAARGRAQPPPLQVATMGVNHGGSSPLEFRVRGR